MPTERQLQPQVLTATPQGRALDTAVRDALAAYLNASPDDAIPYEAVAILGTAIGVFISGAEKTAPRLAPALLMTALKNIQPSMEVAAIGPCTKPDCDVCGGKGTVH